MQYYSMVAAFGLALSLATSVPAADPTELDGTWVEVPYRPSRAEHPGFLPPSDAATLVIDDHLFVMKGGEGVFRQSLIRPVPGQPHKSADLTTVVGGEFWLTRVIYKVEGESLTISESGRKGPRPNSFRRSDATQPEAPLVTTFKRQSAPLPKNSRPATRP